MGRWAAYHRLEEELSVGVRAAVMLSPEGDLILCWAFLMSMCLRSCVLCCRRVVAHTACINDSRSRYSTAVYHPRPTKITRLLKRPRRQQMVVIWSVKVQD